MTRDIRCTHVNVYATSSDPRGTETDHRAHITPQCLDGDQITIEICPLPLESPPVPGLDPLNLPFIDFDLTPAAARILAQTLLQEADAADTLAEIDAVAGRLLASCDEANDPSSSADTTLGS